MSKLEKNKTADRSNIRIRTVNYGRVTNGKCDHIRVSPIDWQLFHFQYFLVNILL